jgi:hypothetical protein
MPGPTLARRSFIRISRHHPLKGGFFVDEEMLAMGADLQEAKQVCKENGKLFEDWCDSGECPVMYKTAQKLMSVQSELGAKKEVNFLFNHGFEVLSKVTQTRDEDIRQALLEHIEQARHQCPAIVSGFLFFAAGK